MGNPKAFSFTEPQIAGYDFSFSGLKTAILYFLQKNKAKNENFIQENLADICASVQSRIVSILLNKLERAALETGITNLAIAGGVSANTGIRSALEALGEKHGWNTYIPKFEYCTDNAAMVSMAGYFKYLEKDFVGQDVTPLTRWAI